MKILALPDMVEDELWDGFVVTSITVDGVAPAATLASVILEFKDVWGAGAAVVTLASPVDISIDDPALWAFTVIAAGLVLNAGFWHFKVTMTDSNGDVRKWLNGTQRILPDS